MAMDTGGRASSEDSEEVDIGKTASQGHGPIIREDFKETTA